MSRGPDLDAIREREEEREHGRALGWQTAWEDSRPASFWLAEAAKATAEADAIEASAQAEAERIAAADARPNGWPHGQTWRHESERPTPLTVERVLDIFRRKVETLRRSADYWRSRAAKMDGAS